MTDRRNRVVVAQAHASAHDGFISAGLPIELYVRSGRRRQLLTEQSIERIDESFRSTCKVVINSPLQLAAWLDTEHRLKGIQDYRLSQAREHHAVFCQRS